MLTIFGLYDRRDDAESALDRLEKEGFNPKDVSVVMRQVEGGDVVESTGSGEVARGAAGGAATGGVIGALAGLLIGVGAIAIPGIGALLIGGPIAAALGITGAAATAVSGAVTGALAGGLVGALTKIGVPEREARAYEERIKTGAILLAVPVKDRDEGEVKRILEDTGATDITSVDIEDNH